MRVRSCRIALKMNWVLSDLGVVDSEGDDDDNFF